MSVDLSMPILVVDDDNSVFRIFNNILQKMGIKDVDNAACGTEAPVKLRYGLVTSNRNMAPQDQIILSSHLMWAR
jgi:DNA-binding NtrC family response regulator